MKKRILFLFAALVLLAMQLAGCGRISAALTGGDDKGGQPSQEKVSANSEPVTLTVFPHKVTLTDAEFQKYFADPVHKKYQNLTLELIHPGKGSNLEDLITAGNVPDLIFTSNGYIKGFRNEGLMEDLNPYIKKDSLNLGIYDAAAMDSIRQVGLNGELYSLPFSLNYGAMFYNKDIFDKFGVPYPKDLMSYEDLLPLARRLNRMADGVQYVGLEPGYVDTMAAQLSVPKVNDQDTPMFDGAAYKKAFDYLKQIYDLPGQIGPDKQTTYNRDSFIKDQTLAMLPDWTNGIVGLLEQAAKQGGFTNWDIAGMPNFQEKLGIGRPVDVHLTVITATGKHKQEAFEVLKTTVSKEVQMVVSAGGLISPLIDDKDIQRNFASDMISFKGKNVQALFKTKPAQLPKQSIYGGKAGSIIRAAQKDVALGIKDVNTALRDAQQEAVKSVQEEKAQ